jgi:hypothetical protein
MHAASDEPAAKKPKPAAGSAHHPSASALAPKSRNRERKNSNPLKPSTGNNLGAASHAKATSAATFDASSPKIRQDDSDVVGSEHPEPATGKHIADCIHNMSASMPVEMQRSAFEAPSLSAQIAPVVAPPPLAAPKTQDPEVPPLRRLQFKLPQSPGANKCRVVTLGYFDNDAHRARVVLEYRTFLRDPAAAGGVDCAKRYSELRCTARGAPVQPKWSRELPVPFFVGAGKLRVRAKMPETDTNVHLGYFGSISECDRVRQEQRLFGQTNQAAGYDYASLWIAHPGPGR